MPVMDLRVLPHAALRLGRLHQQLLPNHLRNATLEQCCISAIQTPLDADEHDTPMDAERCLGTSVLDGNDLRNLQEHDARLIRQALWRNGVVVLRPKRVMTAVELEAFARTAFGPDLVGGIRRDPSLPAFLGSETAFSAYVAPMGNPKGPETLPEGHIFDSRVRIGAQTWHADRDILPMKGLPLDTPYIVMVHVPKVPHPGHSTSFADMQAAYARLPQERKAWWVSQRMWFLSPFSQPRDAAPRVLHPLVHCQPFTGVPSLYIGGLGSRCILEGSEDGTEASTQSTWDKLLDEAVAAGSIYDHEWEEGDLVIWDNTQVLHRANPYDKSRYVRIAMRLGVICDRE